VRVGLSDDQRRRLNEQLGELLDHAMVQALGLDSAEWLPEARRRRPKEAALAEVTITEHLTTVLGNVSSAAAQAAAEAGASYVDLGRASGMTRQGALRRWPGLAEIAEAARRHGRPAAAGATKKEVGRFKISRWEREIQFQLTVAEWTVRDLRDALEPVPADAPLMAIPAEKPGGDFDGELQGVTAVRVIDDLRDPETGTDKPTLVIELDYPSGTYSGKDDESFEHHAEVLTVGAVLAALKDLPRDMPVQVWTVDQPGGSDYGGSTQIIYDAAMGAEWSPPGRGETEGEWVTTDWFGLQLEYPPGVYSRYEDTTSEADE
jgi:hypothetical protein